MFTIKPTIQRSPSRIAPKIHVRKPVVITKAAAIEEVSYYVGKGIILFTMFYCTMNWYHYKTLREKHEKKDK